MFLRRPVFVAAELVRFILLSHFSVLLSFLPFSLSHLSYVFLVRVVPLAANKTAAYVFVFFSCSCLLRSASSALPRFLSRISCSRRLIPLLLLLVLSVVVMAVADVAAENDIVLTPFSLFSSLQSIKYHLVSSPLLASPRLSSLPALFHFLLCTHKHTLTRAAFARVA